MKRTMQLIIFLLAIGTVGFADTISFPANSRSFPIQGVVGKVHEAQFTPVVASGETDYKGMPFNIMGTDVAAEVRAETGRLVAKWSLLTNYAPAKLTVVANKMQGVMNPNAKLDYELYIKYQYSCINTAGGTSSVDNALTVRTTDSNGTASVRLDLPAGAIGDSFIAINDNPIRFHFLDTAQLGAAPEDDFLANVKFEVTSI